MNTISWSVAPFAGAWIEISLEDLSDEVKNVAPFAGAWIEIHLPIIEVIENEVAPFAGAWIEITKKTRLKY